MIARIGDILKQSGIESVCLTGEEIIRCKNCKWYDEQISICDNCRLPREQMFFCADGKKKEEDDDQQRAANQSA